MQGIKLLTAKCNFLLVQKKNIICIKIKKIVWFEMALETELLNNCNNAFYAGTRDHFKYEKNQSIILIKIYLIIYFKFFILSVLMILIKQCKNVNAEIKA